MFGMFVPGGQVTDVSKGETLWGEYHFGVSNGSNDKADNNSAKDVYGRFVLRKMGQTLGVFGHYSPDTYDDNLRTHASIGNDGIMSGIQQRNSRGTAGVDFTLSLAPFGTPVWLDNQLMSIRESSPTGFDTAFRWNGGFHQLNWQVAKEAMAYGRYDWINGKRFDDRTKGGVTVADPREWDVVVGAQYLINQNIKLVGEFRHHEFEDRSGTPNTAKIKDDGFTIRIMIGL